MSQNQAKIPIPFIATIVVLGLIVFAFAIAKGNQPIVSPDLSKYVAELQNEVVSSEWLADSIIQGDELFRTVGLRPGLGCAEQKRVTTAFECYEQSKLMDSHWVRQRFRNINEPLVVMGDDTEDGLLSAAKLRYWGFNSVKVLEGGFYDFELEYLEPEYGEIDVAEADADELKQLAVYQYFTGNDPLVKRKGETWVMASGGEEEIEGAEEGAEEDDDWSDFEDMAEEEGC